MRTALSGKRTHLQQSFAMVMLFRQKDAAFTGPGGTLGTLTGTNIGDGSFFGATAEDRFFGWIDLGGISSVTITDPGGGLEVDHLQYGRLAAPVPSMPTVVLLLTAALLLTIGVRRLRPRLA